MSDFYHPQPLTDEQIALLESLKPILVEEAENFDMQYFIHYCNSPSCIAGHLVHLAQPEQFRGMSTWAVERTAHEIVGVKNMSCSLFYAYEWGDELQQAYYATLEEEFSPDGDFLGYGDSKDPNETVKVAIRAIDRYIQNTKAHFAEAQT